MSSIDTTSGTTVPTNTPTSAQPSALTNIAPSAATSATYVGINTEIGKGTYKTVYSCIETDDVNNKIFTLPHDVSIDKLVIAVLDINKIVKYLMDEKDQEFFEIYINNPQKIYPKTKQKWEAYLKKLIDNQIKTINEEIELQNLFFEKQLAPKIYEHRFDEDKKMFYILEEKCGSSFLTYINNKTNQTEDNFNKIVELVTKIADTGYINVDIKPENTCTKFAENGSLSEIIALDFDTDFFINFDLTNEEIKEHGKIFMLTLFIAYLKKYANIVFKKDIVKTHLDCKKIEDMLTFFARNTEICAKEMHPIFMLYHYIITNPQKGSCSFHQTHEQIENLTRIICSYIFLPTNRGSTKGGSRRPRKSRRSKKSKKSNKSRK